jgi:coenzyme F420-0:L-glutamate ligase/coenzyme F420-1:gamma-L-glutamate ligase
VAVVRGFFRPSTAESATSAEADLGARPLLRDAASDMFSLGTAEARVVGLLDAARLAEGNDAALPGFPVDPEAVQRALTAVADVLARGTTVTPADVMPNNGATAALHLTTRDNSPTGWMRLGADTHRLRAALAAESIATVTLPHEDGIRLDLSALTAPERLP